MYNDTSPDKLQRHTFETAMDGEISPVREGSPLGGAGLPERLPTIHEQSSLHRSNQKSGSKFEIAENPIITREEPYLVTQQEP